MSGQTPQALYEQESSDISQDLEIEIDAENLDIVDPLADFIEKHGYKLVRNHEGEYVTVAEAIENCPPFRRLVLAMGEGALALMAVQKPKEEVETADETEGTKDEAQPNETETAAQTQDESPRAPDMHSEKEEAQTGQATDIGGGPLPEAAVQTSPAESTSGNSDSEPSRPESIPLGADKESDISPASPSKISELSKTLTSDTVTQPADQPQKEVPELKVEVRRPAETSNEVAEKPGIATATGKSDIKEPEASSARILEPKTPERLAEIETETSQIISESSEIDSESEKLSGQTFVEQDSNNLETDMASAVTGPKAAETADVTSKVVEDATAALERYESDLFSEQVISADREEEKAMDVISKALPDKDILKTEAEQPAYDYKQFETPEPPFELSLPVEEVEHTVQQLAERIEALEDDGSQAVFDILDKITAKSEEIVSGPYDTEGQEQALDIREDKVEELKELFIELFDQVEMDYTPELLESFAKLAIRGDIAEFAEAIEADGENEVMTDRGTHEAIIRLLAAVSRIKKAAGHAYNIGRSMLRLYSQQMTASA